MHPCRKCLENNWKFTSMPNNFMRATCVSCANEVEWQIKVKYEEKWDHGSMCPECKIPLTAVTKPPNAKRLKQKQYFSTFFKCLKCMKVFLNEKYKVINV